MRAWVVTLFFVLWLCAIPHAEAAESLSISDCSPAVITILKHRIFEKDGKLRPIILSRDVLHLSACEGAGRFSIVTRIEGRLKREFVLESREIAITSDGTSRLAQAASDACAQQKSCTVEVYRKKSYKAPKIIPFAKSGGLPFARFLGHAGVDGHYEITARGVRDLTQVLGTRWTQQALDVLKDASRDADFYEWSNPAAHAQTVNDDQTGKLDPSQIASAPTNFENWAGAYLSAAVQACRDNQVRDALYLLGYSLHGIQDLVFHEGISNAEHSFRDFVEDVQLDAVDHYAEKMQLASEATVGMLRGFRSRIAPVAPRCWEKMIAFGGDTRLSARDREVILSKSGKIFTGKDFGVPAYFAYRGLAAKVRDGIVEQKTPPESFFIAAHWLGGRQHSLLDGFVSRIVAKIPQ